MRAFIAIPLPDYIKEALSECQFPHDAIRWQPSENFHITLRFLGDIADDKLKAVADELVAIETPSFTLRAGGWGTFPKRGKPNVLWAGVQKSDSLMKLKEAVDAICAKFTAEEHHPSFNPHITLGRIRGAVEQAELTPMAERLTDWKSEMTVNSFATYESQLTQEGAEHHIIKEYPLQD